MIYNTFIKRRQIIPSAENKWVENYPFLEVAKWAEIYRLPFKACRDTFNQSLQYKIIHRFFNCNYNLYIWKIIDSPACSFCNKIDTIEHYFYDCLDVFDFWGKMKKWLTQITQVNLNLTILEIILGIVENVNFIVPLNYIILQANLFIYKNKKEDRSLFFLGFLLNLKKTIETEK